MPFLRSLGANLRRAALAACAAHLLIAFPLEAAGSPCASDAERAQCATDPGGCPCPEYGECGMGSCFVDTERVRAQGYYRAGLDAILEGNPGKAVADLRTALEHLERSVRDVRSDRAAIEDALGLALVRSEDYRAALEHSQNAVELYRDLRPPGDSARAHAELQLADVLRALGRPGEATNLYRGFLEAMAGAGDTRGRATGHNKLGLALDDLGRPAEAIEEYAKALHLLRSGGRFETGQIVPVLTNLATSHGTLGNHAEAYKRHTEARALMAQAFGETSPYVATIDHNRASSLERMGRLEEAAALYRSALGTYERTPNQRSRAAATRAWLSIVLAQLGDYASGEVEAERAHQDLVALYGETHPSVATSWNHRGWLAQYAGRDTEALEAYSRFTAILKATLPPGHPDIAVGINNVGTALGKLGRAREALAAYEEALRIEIAARGETWPRVSVGYNNIGTSLFTLGDTAGALEAFDKARAHRIAASGEIHPHVAELWMSSAGVYLALGDTPRWIAAIEQAVLASRRGEAPWDGTPSTLRRDPGTLTRLAYLAWAISEDTRRDTLERLRTAVGVFDTALGVMTRMRAHLSGTSREIHERRQADMFIWSLKLRSDLAALDPTLDPRGAVAGIELVSAWSLLEQIAAQRSQGYLDARAESVAMLSAIADRLARRRQEEPTPAVLQEIRELEEGVERELERLRRESPRYAALHHPRPASAEAVQAALDPGEVVVSFVKGRYGAFAVAVTRDTCRLADLGDPVALETALHAARIEMASVTSRSRARVRDRGRRRTPNTLRGESPRNPLHQSTETDPLRALDARILEPLATLLEGRRIIVVPGTAFEGVAFGALRAPDGRWRIDHHEIVYAPSMAIFVLLRELNQGTDHGRVLDPTAPPRGSPTILALGDPAYTGRPDPSAARSITRYGAERGTWGALPASGAEVRAIAALFPPDSRLVLTGGAAAEGRLEAESWTRIPFLHFACHGALEEGPNREPALVLSLSGNAPPADGFLTLSEISSRRLEADLVTLSACNSGRSASTRPPTGVSSLSRAFLLAGARNVVVSLWPVSDQATARLMVEFYREMLRAGKPPAAALRAASLRLRDRMGHAAPAHWAPFILQGAL